jgi:hypothetical protein
VLFRVSTSVEDFGEKFVGRQLWGDVARVKDL